MITEPTDVSPENNTLFTPEVTHMITEFVDVPHEDLRDKALHVIELAPGVSLPDVGMEVVPYPEPCKVSTALKVKQQCLIPTDRHAFL